MREVDLPLCFSGTPNAGLRPGPDTFGDMRERAVRIFLLVVVMITVPALTAVLYFGHVDLHRSINGFNAPWADTFFAWSTNLADGWVPTCIALCFLFFRWRWFLMLASSAAFSAIIIQVLKHTFFADVDRPSMFMEAMPGLHLVPGVEMLHHNSFPSGHSTCAFSMCFALAVIIGRAGPAAGWALLAVLLAFSRVYLSQHFTEDALAGALIGTATGWCVYRWLYVGSFSRKKWLDRSLLSRSKR